MSAPSPSRSVVPDAAELVERLAALQDEVRERLEPAELLSLTPEACWFHADAEGRCRFVAARWTEWTGQPTDTDEVRWWEVAHREEQDRLERAWQESVRARQHFDQRFRIGRGDLADRWLEVRAIALPPEECGRIAFVGSLRRRPGALPTRSLHEVSYDLLARLSAGAPLETMLETLATTAESVMPGAMCSILLRRGSRLHEGAAPSLPRFYTEAIDGVEWGEDVGSCGRAVATGETVVTEDIRLDPRWVPFRELAERAGLRACWSVPIRAAGDEVVGALAVYYREPCRPSVADLEFVHAASHLAGLAFERKRTEERLRERERQLLGITDSLPVLIAQVDVEGRYVFNNAMYENWFGCSRASLRGRTVRELLGEKNYAKVESALRRAYHGRQSLFEGEIEFPDGRQRTLHVRYVPELRTDGHVEGIFCLAEDITERRRREEDTRLLQERAQQAQRLESLGVLAGGIAHDFNNLLTVILGNADLIEADLPAGSPLREQLLQITSASDQASQLCAQMLAYAGKGRLQTQLEDLDTLVEKLRPLLEASVAGGIAIEYDLAGNLPRVDADSVQLRQVLLNLTRNASDAIAGTEGRIVVRTSFVARGLDESPGDAEWGLPLTEGEYVRLEVADTGSGIPSTEIDRIFDPFYTTKPTGHGLGLAAVLGIVRAHRGNLRLETTPGIGSRFRVYLPALPRAASDAGHGLETTYPQKEWVGTALVIEDEEPVQRVAATMLGQAGYEVLVAEDGESGLDQIRRHGHLIDVVFLDLSMPKMRGEEVFRHLRVMQPDLPVIVSSGHSQVELLERFTGALPAGFLHKPYRRADLERVLAKVLSPGSKGLP